MCAWMASAESMRRSGFRCELWRSRTIRCGAPSDRRRRSGRARRRASGISLVCATTFDWWSLAKSRETLITAPRRPVRLSSGRSARRRVRLSLDGRWRPAAAARLNGELDTRREAELGEDVREVRADRPSGHEQASGDLGVRQTFAHEIHHEPLRHRQRLPTFGRPAARAPTPASEPGAAAARLGSEGAAGGSGSLVGGDRAVQQLSGVLG